MSCQEYGFLGLKIVLTTRLFRLVKVNLIWCRRDMILDKMQLAGWYDSEDFT